MQSELLKGFVIFFCLLGFMIVFIIIHLPVWKFVTVDFLCIPEVSTLKL